MSTPPTFPDSLIVPSDLGQGGANLSDGSPKLGEIMKAWDAYLRGLVTSDTEGLGLDSIGIIHEREDVQFWDPEVVKSAMDALIATMGRANDAYYIGFGASAGRIKKASGAIFFLQLQGQPIQEFVYSFDSEALLPYNAIFHACVINVAQKFDDPGHSSIKISVGLQVPPTSPDEGQRTAISLPIEIGTTTTIENKFAPGVPGEFAFTGCPIGNKNLILRIKSDANLDQLLQGIIAVDVYYFTP